jgi:glutamine amidotransferase
LKFEVLNLPNANVNSVFYWLKRCGYRGEILDLNEPKISSDSFVIIPGVGSFDYAMECLNTSSMDKKLQDHAEKNGFILGICLGMQLLFESSDEGMLNGLGLIRGKITKLPSGKNHIPNVGWRTLENGHCSDRFKEENFYFTHTYCYLGNEIDNDGCEFATSYSNEKFVAFLKHGNLYCAQFHPEKSGQSGINFLRKIVNENSSSS